MGFERKYFLKEDAAKKDKRTKRIDSKTDITKRQNLDIDLQMKWTNIQTSKQKLIKEIIKGESRYTIYREQIGKRQKRKKTQLKNLRTTFDWHNRWKNRLTGRQLFIEKRERMKKNSI